MQQTCTHCGSAFTFDAEEQSFLDKIVFRFGNALITPAVPTKCPACRLQIRTCHRNERYLQKRKSDLSGKDIVAIYAKNPMRPCTVYAQDEWHSEAWDPMTYGRPYDLQRPFFEQFKELQTAVPRMAVVTVANENCEYTTGTGYCKNCYLINSSEYSEDCSYGKLFQKCRRCMDSAYLFSSELCYECFSCTNCYECRYLSFGKNCSDCSYSSQLVGCKNCFLCTNLERKEYHVRNKPVPKAEYEGLMATIADSFSAQKKAKAELDEIVASSVHRSSNMVNAENCSGDYIENSQNCRDCFDVSGSQDCRNVTVGVETKDCYDCSNMYIKPELCVMTLGTIEAYNCAYCLYVFHSQNLLYSENCYHSSDLFGCSGLRHKQYCIFNVQHTKEEYEKLVPEIIEKMRKTPLRPPDGSAAGQEWGEFFPPSLSPFGYNESLAQEYMPLTQEEAKRRGFHWRSTHDDPPNVSKVIAAADLPNATKDAPDDILQWAIRCEESHRPFRLQKTELEFYRDQKIPLPRKHPDIRYDERMKQHNPRTVWRRTCAHCGKTTVSTYAPDRPETIWCEECFRNEAMR